MYRRDSQYKFIQTILSYLVNVLYIFKSYTVHVAQCKQLQI